MKILKVFFVFFTFLFNSYLFPITNYVLLFLDGKISLQKLVSDFTYSGRYEELFNVLSNILEKTNLYDVRVEKVKIGYSLGKNILEDFYVVINTNVFRDYFFYTAFFSDEKFLDDFSLFILKNGIRDFWVINNFSRLCFVNNYLDPVVNLVSKMRFTNSFLVSELIDRLYSFSMFESVSNVFYSLRDLYSFSEEDLILIGRSLGELGDEECLRIFSKDYQLFIPFRVEFLVRFGYIEEGVYEARKTFVTSRVAKYLFIAFINLGKYEDARLFLAYINDYSTKSYFSCVLDLLVGKNVLEVEKRLKSLLVDSNVDFDVKNQVGFLLWILNTSESKKTMDEEIILSLNYFNGVKNSRYSSSRVLDRLKGVDLIKFKMKN